MSKYLLCSIVIAALMIGTSFSVLASIGSPTEQTQKATIAKYTTHESISINGNDDFAAQGWPGEGTESNPYIIQDLEIDMTGINTHAINISNSDVHFEITNCFLHDAKGVYPYAGAGIFLSNVANGFLSDNVCNDNLIGIQVEYSVDNNISGNTCLRNDWYGIFLASSENGNISNNNCSDNSDSGIMTQSESIYNNLSNNFCSNNRWDGIYDGGIGSTLFNNTCTYNMFGIEDQGETTALIGNNCSYNRYGISGVCTGHAFINNNCSYNTEDGIRLIGYSDPGITSLMQCTITWNGGYGIYARSIDYGIILDIEDCDVSNNSWTGVYLEAGTDLNLTLSHSTITWNCVSGGWTSGIEAYTGIGDLDIAVDDSTISFNGNDGIYAEANRDLNLTVSYTAVLSNRQTGSWSGGIEAYANNNVDINLTGCIIDDQADAGIFAEAEVNVSLDLKDCDLSWNAGGWGMDGGIVVDCCQNIRAEMEGCNISNNDAWGIYLEPTLSQTIEVKDSAISWNGEDGVYATSSVFNAVDSDFSYNGGCGLRLTRANGGLVHDNTIQGNSDYGIEILDPSSGNNLVWNNKMTSNNGAGDIYDPLFVQAYDEGADWWNSTEGYGNWWSDWKTPDILAPLGIIDQPYVLGGGGGGRDYYPRATTTCTLTSPTNASIYFTNWCQVKLIGTAYDNTKVTAVTWANDRGGSDTAYMTSQNGGQTVSWQSRGNIILFPGDNVITVTAYDNSGSSATDVLTVTLDTTPPSCVITMPTLSSQYFTTTASVNLVGTASDANGIASVVWHNVATGASGTATITTDWNVSGIALNPGWNLIFANATDMAGNRFSDGIFVYRDNGGPSVTISDPTANPTMTTNWHYVILKGTATDNNKVTTVAWSNALTGESGTMYLTPQWGGASVTWQTRGRIHLLPGINELTVTAYDNAGNTATDILTVTYTGL